MVTYGCYAEPFGGLRHAREHHAAGRFPLDSLDGLHMADGYRRSIGTWASDPPAAGRGR